MMCALRRMLLAVTLTALLAAACSTPVTAHGTVLDARTNQPVGGARVSQGSSSATTGADGGFRLGSAAPGGHLSVSAAGYAPQSVPLPAGALTVRLVPIPVTGTVTSSYNNQPVHARVGTGESGADGRFTVYGAGPGDTLLVTSPLYTSQRVTVGVTRTVTVRMAPARIDPHAALANIATYTVTPLPSHDASLLAGLNATPALKDANPAVASGSVALPGGGVDAVFALVFDPATVEQGQFAPEVLANLAAGGLTLGATLDGVPVQVTRQPSGKIVVSWQQATVFFGVEGFDQTKAQALAAAMITANR